MHMPTPTPALLLLLLAGTSLTAAQSPTPTTTACTGICPAIAAPVCGTDGRQYGNSCGLSQAACAIGPLSNLTIAYTGPCRNENCDAIVCPSPTSLPFYGAYCGADNNDYTDLCALEVAACKGKFAREPVRYEPCDCRKITCDPPSPTAVPVCDFEGKVYGSLCELRVRSCTEPDNRALTPTGCPATLLPSTLRPTGVATMTSGVTVMPAAPAVPPRVTTATLPSTRSDAGAVKAVVAVVAGAAAIVAMLMA
ncbi:hypothetical protein HDU96_002899 [Phlyctochytrium bullatum]|nr:hypothetical protein HDU96_002899 [Phlyctochytrium bullatum]